MSHYFENDETLPKTRKEITFQFLDDTYTFETMAGIFSKSDLDFGSRILLETIINNYDVKGKILDLGTGFGPIGILLKLYFPQTEVLMSDVNERAIEIASINVTKYKLDNKLILSDGFNNINDLFDMVVFNPPIRTGKKNIYRLFQECLQHLTTGGTLFVVVRKDQGASSALKFLNEIGKAEVINKEKGYWIIKIQNSD